MKQINDSSGGIYYYLISQDGEMIYHPRGTELNRGLFEENSLKRQSMRMEPMRSIPMVRMRP